MSAPAVVRPTLLVDRERATRNIERMVSRARSAGVALRPHFKTHRSIAVGRWFRDLGVSRITVSSVEMARYFAEDDWSDITIAFPVNMRELAEIEELSRRVRLGLLVDSITAAEVLGRSEARAASLWIKVDTGYGRAGVPWDSADGLAALAEAVREGGRLAGVLAHNGTTYGERSPEGVRRAHGVAADRLARAAAVVSSVSGGACAVSIGDTPSASVADTFEGVDEIRPGNFVFNDLTQAAIGSCGLDDIAVAVACPVVSVYPERGRALFYGGAVHLSLDSVDDGQGRRIYGSASLDWPSAASADAPVVSLSQEHGLIELDGAAVDSLRPGDLAFVLPAHSCLTCNLHAEYLTLSGERLSTMRSCRAR